MNAKPACSAIGLSGSGGSFTAGQNWQTLELTGEESFEITGLDESLAPHGEVTVTATTAQGNVQQFSARVRIDTPVELDYYRNGGILQTVLRRLLKG